MGSAAGRLWRRFIWKPLYASEQKITYYKPLPRFPAVERDLALLCDEELPVAEIEKTIRSSGEKIWRV